MEQVKEGYLIDCISGKTLKATPEEVQAVQPFAKKLMEDYGYPIAHIQTRPQWHVKVRPSDVKKEYPVVVYWLFFGIAYSHSMVPQGFGVRS